MPKVYAGFNIADSMFDGDCTIQRKVINAEQFKGFCGPDVIAVFNRAHEATIRALKQRYGLDLEIPTISPRIILRPGDLLLTATLRGLPRHTHNHNYSDEEVARATFTFAVYNIKI